MGFGYPTPNAGRRADLQELHIHPRLDQTSKPATIEILRCWLFLLLGIGPALPAVAGERQPAALVVVSDNATAAFFDAMTGEAFSNVAFEAKPVDIVGYKQSVIVALDGGQGDILALSALNGGEIWRTTVGFEIAGLTTSADGQIIAAGANGGFARLGAATGGRLSGGKLPFRPGILAHADTRGRIVMSPRSARSRVASLNPNASEHLDPSDLAMIDFGGGIVKMAVAEKHGLIFAQVNGYNGFKVAEADGDGDVRRVKHERSLGLPSLIREFGFLDFNGFNRCEGLAVRPGEREVWSTCGKNLNVHLIEKGDFPAKGHMRMPGKGSWISFAPDGAQAFVTVPDDNAILVVDAGSLQFIRTIEIDRDPERTIVIPLTGKAGSDD
ncbi:MAG: hypothetical protein GC152_10965 [Alphaproteobacteria bacterium]|nr:hypothetical protein [Alphaproteobacteria bacterium]